MMTKAEAVKWLESLKREIGKTENSSLWHYAEAIDMVIEAMPVPKTGEWIPVSERLPKEKDRVLTYDSIGHIDFGQYDKGLWYWEAESCADYWMRNDGVLAWMPLPEPYKGGDDE